MAKGRKNGCPVNIRNWLIEILDVATKEWIRIFGLNSMTRGVDAETEDGSADTDAWSEEYVTKRSASLSLEGKPVVVESTGAIDPGQDLLNYYAEQVGCESDATLRLTDPYGHAVQADFIVNSKEESADASGSSVSWDLTQVGEAEQLPYVHVESVALHADESAVTELSMQTGDAAKLVELKFTPETASNKRFKVSNSKRAVANVVNITDGGFSIMPVAAGETTITVTTANGPKTASIKVTVT